MENVPCLTADREYGLPNKFNKSIRAEFVDIGHDLYDFHLVSVT